MNIATVARKAAVLVGILLILSALAAGFMAYFLYHTNPETNIMYDGFGRQLSETPLPVRWIFGQDRVWAGWPWSILDLIVFFGGMAGGVGLCHLGVQERDK